MNINFKYFYERKEYLIFVLFFSSLIFSVTVAQGLAILIILLWVYKIFKHKSFTLSYLDIIFLFFLSIRLLSVVFSVDIELSSKFIYKKLFFALIFFGVQIPGLIRNDKDIKFFLKIIVITGILASIIAFFIYILNEFNVWILKNPPEIPLFGKSRLSEYLMIITLIGVGVYPMYLFLPALFVVLFTESRAAVTAIIVSGSFKFFNEKKWVPLLSLVLLVLGSLTYQPIRKKFVAFVQGEKLSMSGREFLWGEAKDIISDRPLLGHGPGTATRYTKEVLNKVPTGYTWHSDYLQIYLESGIISLFSYLLLLFYAFWLLWRGGSTGRILFYPLLGMSLISFVGGHIWDPVLRLLFFSFLGFTSIISKNIIKKNEAIGFVRY